MARPTPPRSPSPIDAFGEGFSHMRSNLFGLGFFAWLTLGFVSFLEGDGLLSTGARFTQDTSRWAPGSGLVDFVETWLAWVSGHLMIVVFGLLLIMVISLFFAWIRSRMLFVYIDDVATGRGDLIRPWNEHGGRADSFFLLSILAQGAAFIVIVLIVGLAVLLAIWGRGRDWTVAAILLAQVPLFFLLMLALLATAALNMVLRDFVAPLQIVHDIGAREAAERFLALLNGRPFVFLGYAIAKLIAMILLAVIIFVLSCLTCCVGFLPVVGHTIFQPFWFTERAWSLKFLAHFGEDVFSRLAPPAPPAPFTPPSPDEAPTGPIDLSAIDFEDPPKSNP